MSNPHDVAPMVKTYKKVFVYLSIITVIGIIIALLHPPVWFIVVIGLIFIVSKSVIVYEAFKNLLAGRNLIIITFLLTACFVAGLVMTGIVEDKSHLIGTEDTQKALLMEQHAAPKDKGSHGH
jgi:hypothetical protein